MSRKAVASQRPGDLEQYVFGPFVVAQLLGIEAVDDAADHGGDHLFGSRPCNVERGDVAAVAQHRDAVAIVEDLGHAVRDVDDADAFAGKLVNDLEQFLRLALG